MTQPNQPTDHSHSDAAHEKPKPGLTAHHSGIMDHDALEILKHHHHKHKHYHHLHHVELHGHAEPASAGALAESNVTNLAEPHQIKKSETLSQIAKEAIGTHATNREIYDLVSKIVDANRGNKYVKDADKIVAGGVLVVPEHISHAAQSAPAEAPAATRPGAPAAPDRPAAPADVNTTRPAAAADTTAPGPGTAPGDQSGAAPPAARPADAAPAPGQPPASINQDEIEADARALHKATGQDNKLWRFANAGEMNKILEGKTDAQRAAIAAQYKTDFGVTLADDAAKHLSGTDLDTFNNTLNRQDNNAASQNADRIHEDLDELHNMFQGRSTDQIEKDIRDTLSSHNSDQIHQMEAEYAKAHPGQTLQDAIADSNLSQTTKEMAKVYLNHSEANTDQESKQLVDVALKSKNVEIFNEVMAEASQSVRDDFMKNGGEQRINDAFGGLFSGNNVQHALDYAREGKLDAATQIQDNHHIFNNNDGIELAIKQMTPDERAMYQNGKLIAEGKPPANVTGDAATQASQYYERMRTAMSNTGNSTDVAKWEDEIATAGKGSFVDTLTADSHWYGNTSTGDIQQQMRTMSASDWQDAKDNSGRRDEVVNALQTLGKSQDDINKTMAIYDHMMSADTYDHATDGAKQSVLDVINSNKHWYGDNQTGVLDAIQNMSQSDQQKFRTDANFRNQVEAAVNGSVEDVDQQAAAKRMFDAIQAGKSPQGDIITALERLQNYDGSKTQEAVTDIQNAMKADPTLKDRILHDPQFAAQFKSAVQNAFGDDYDNFGKPFVEQGDLSLDMKMHLAQGVFSNDDTQIYKDIASASQADRDRLANDATYRQQVIGFLSPDRQAIALAVAKQGEVRLEDTIRDAAAGFGGSSDIMTALKGMKPQDLDAMREAYASKYGVALEVDLQNKLGGTDRDQAERILTENLNVETRVNIAKDQTENTRSGIGSAISDNVFGSATGSQADNAQDQTVAALAAKNEMDKAIADGTELAQGMTPEQQQQLQAQMMQRINDAIETENTATDNHAAAKASAAEYVSDAAIAAVAIGSMIVTGGADAPLVLALAAAGAGIKVGTNATMEGNDYDWSVGNVAKDALTGSVTAATSVIGPGEVAAVFGIGKQAAEESAMVAVNEIGQSALRDGGEAIIQDGTRSIVREALAGGAKKLDEKAFTALAEKAIAPDITGAARQEAVERMASTLQEQVSSRMAKGIVARAQAQALNMAGGGFGGGAGGVVQGATEWDSRQSIGANLEHVAQTGMDGAMSGAVGGGVMTVGMEGLGSVVRTGSRAWSSENNIIRNGIDNVMSRVGGLGIRDADATALDAAETVVKVPVSPDVAPDLSEGRLNLARESSGNPNHAEVRAGVLTHADGTSERVFFHASEHEPDLAAARLAKEQAAVKLNRMFDFSGRYPESVALGDDVSGHTGQGWLQEAAGTPLEDELRRRAVAQFGTSGRMDEDVAKILAADPKFAHNVEEAVVERVVYGDHDIAAKNLGVTGDGVRNFDLGEGFNTLETPEIFSYQKNLATIGLQNAMSGREISADIKTKLSDFLQHYNNPTGMEQLRATGLNDEQINAMFARTRILVETGKLPQIDANVNDPDGISMWRYSERADGRPLSRDIQHDPAGRVAEVKTKGGTQTFQYFADGAHEGEPKAVTLANGTKYTTTDGERWTVTPPKGRPQTIEGTMTVDQHGNMSFKTAADDVTTTYRTDNTQVRADARGNRTIIGADGRIDSVGDARGRAALYDYGDDGRLLRVRRADGSTLERVGDLPKSKQQQWLLKDQQHAEGRLIQGQTTLQPDGTIDIKTANGSETLRPNGATVQRDAADRVTRTVDSGGHETAIGYDRAGTVDRIQGADYTARRIPQVDVDAEGRVTKIVRPPNNREIRVNYDTTPTGEPRQTLTIDGQKYTSTDGENWTVSRVRGARQKSEWKGKINVNENGDVSLKADGSNDMTVYRADGVKAEYSGDQIQSASVGRDSFKRLEDGTWERVSGEGRPAKGELVEGKYGLVFQDKDGTVTGTVSPWSKWESTFKDAAGNRISNDEVASQITVDHDGTVRIPTERGDQLRYTDQGLEIRSAVGTHELRGGVDAQGRPLIDDMPSDDFHQAVKKGLNRLWNPEDLKAGVLQVESELKNVRTTGPDGREMSVYDSLRSDTTLSDSQKDNVLENLARVREHFGGYRAGDQIHPDAQENWIHTQGELGHVLESARANHLSANETEDALLASMYSDSVKFGNPPPQGAESNFLVHHLDGALAAKQVLGDREFAPNRVAGIVQAIKEHQVAPPVFMAGMYYTGISGALDKLAASGEVPAEKIAQMRATLENMSEQVGDRRVISGIAHADQVRVQGENGYFEVPFTQQQQELLKLVGVDKWSVPVDPHMRSDFNQLPKADQDRLMSQFRVSQTLIDGDAIDNYASLGGASKIVALRRPGEEFSDPTVWSALRSSDSSFKDAYTVMSAEGKRVADANFLTKAHALEDEQNGIRAQMDSWLRSRGLDPATTEVPYYNADLKYPKPLTSKQAALLAKGVNADGTPLTQVERESLQFKGLSQRQIAQFKTAQEISDHMRDLLRSAGRVDGSLPGDVNLISGRVEGPWALAEQPKFTMPETHDVHQAPDGTWTGITDDGRAIASDKDGSFTITDRANHSSLTYDRSGNVTDAVNGARNRTFKYARNGELSEVHYDDGRTLTRKGQQWSLDGNKIEGQVQVGPEGNVRYIDKYSSKMTIDHMDGSSENLASYGRRDWMKADLSTESARFQEMVEKNYTNPRQLERVNRLMNEFNEAAATRGYDENKRALFYKQINRLLADDPNSVIPQSERVALAEQVVNHAAHPESVDQGANSTCNVTTIEVRNYVRNPERQAQMVADIADTGKFVTATGETVDLNPLQSGLKPDAESLKNLRLQAENSGLIKEDGSRDFASQITEMALVNTHWQLRVTTIVDGADVGPGRLAYNDNSLIGSLKNPKDLTLLYDKDHNPVNRLAAGEIAYNQEGQPLDVDRSRVLSANGTAFITPDSNIVQIYDSTGGRFRFRGNPAPGLVGYDSEGRAIMKVTEPGDIRYDKELDEFGERERVMYHQSGEWKPLRDAKEKAMEAPKIYSHFFEGLDMAAMNVNERSWLISAYAHDNLTDFENNLLDLKDTGNFPAVAEVHTSNPPFSPTSRVGGAGGNHVVAIHDYDPETHTIYYTNEWGSDYDHLIEGVPAQLFFDGMRNHNPLPDVDTPVVNS
jgi:hypothetical protein